MKLNKKQINEYKNLKRRLAYEQLQNRIGYLCLGLAFISFIFIQSMTLTFVVGAILFFSHCFVGKNTKQLLKFSDELVKSQSDSSITAADINDLND